jgi:hypothetical protein
MYTHMQLPNLAQHFTLLTKTINAGVTNPLTKYQQNIKLFQMHDSTVLMIPK